MKYYIGVDIGGTNIKAAMIDEDHNVIETAMAPTDPGSVASSVALTVEMLFFKHSYDIKDICAIGIAVPGIIEGIKGPVIYTPNLNISGHDMISEISDEISKRIKIDIRKDKYYLENDANCAGIAESYLGAGKDKELMLLLTLGTGLGGALIKDKKPVCFGKYGGEFGHFPFISGGKKCSCGMRGCFEQYVNSAAYKEYGEDQYAVYLATGIAGFVNIFRPDIVVLAGGVTNAGPSLFEKVNLNLLGQVYAGDMIKPPRVVRTELYDNAGAIGAAVFAMNSFAH